MSGRDRESARQFREHFARYTRLDVSRSKWAMARRLARGRFCRKRGGLGLRAFQALNVCGLRIWVDKPRFFRGLRWAAAARRATVATVAARAVAS